jgi:tetrahydromethanopterin S-methyltransferase subunit G
MVEEYPEIRSLAEGINKLFPSLTAQQRKELLDGIRRALMEVLGSEWGEREISVDSMREKMRDKLEREIGKIETIPDDEKRIIVSRLGRLIPAEELVRLKGKVKQSIPNRDELRRKVVEAFEEILGENLGIDVKSLKEIEEILDNIIKDLGKSKSNEKIPGEGEESKKEVSGQADRDEVKKKLDEIEKKLDAMLEEGEKESRTEGGRKFESWCEDELMNIILDIINMIDEKIKKFEKEEGKMDEIDKIKEKISKIKEKISKIINNKFKELIESYGVREEIKRLCEEIEKSVDVSAYLIEGAESIIVDNMNRMVRKDLGLYISWSLGNPMREFYYRIRRGEEV